MCKYENTAKEFKKVIETTCQSDAKGDVGFRITIDCGYWRS